MDVPPARGPGTSVPGDPLSPDGAASGPLWYRRQSRAVVPWFLHTGLERAMRQAPRNTLHSAPLQPLPDQDMPAAPSNLMETAVVAFATFFATVGPLDVSAVFVAMTPRATPRERLAMVVRGVAIAAVILITFALVGRPLLSSLGISLAALRVAGGILLLLIGIDMVFARSSGGVSTTEEETQEAAGKQDISVFPLATPLIAGPGAIGASILLMANAEGHWMQQAVVIVTLIAVLLLTLLGLLLANQVVKLFGITGLHVISRVFGVLLTALAVQFIFDGVQQSGLLTGAMHSSQWTSALQGLRG